MKICKKSYQVCNWFVRSSYQKKQHKKYGGNIANVYKSIDFDIGHGVTREEVLLFLDKVRNDANFSLMLEIV
jgi:hypothetical protein